MLMQHQDRIPELKAALPDILSCTDLKKVSATSYHGSCPVCGGNDRFVYKTDSGKCWCRQCHPAENPMDVIDFHYWLYGKAIPELIKEYLPEIDPTHTPPQKTIPDLLCTRRGLAEEVIRVLTETRGLLVTNHAGKQSVAVPFKTLQGETRATQYLSINQEPFSFTKKNGSPANKVFGKGDKPGSDCFFLAGPGPNQAKILTISESVINAMTAYQLFPDACCIALGGSTYIRKVAALKPYMNSVGKVVVCQDNDDAGAKMLHGIHKILGDKVYSLAWGPSDNPGLDINDLLQAGQGDRGRELINNAVPVCTDIFQPKTITADFDPTRLLKRKWIVTGLFLRGMCQSSLALVVSANQSIP